MKPKTHSFGIRGGLLALAVFGASSLTAATVTLLLEDYPDVGTRNRMDTDTTGHAAVVIGPAGENQTWDFTQAIHGRQIGMDYVLPSETLYGASVPGAERAIKTWQWLSVDPVPIVFPSGLEGFFEVYYYQKMLSADGVLQGNGMGAVSPIYSGGFTFTEPSVELSFPMAVGKTWLKKYEFSAPATVGALSTTLVTKDSSVMEVDAAGRLTIPLGTFDCVRVKAARHLTLKAQLFGTYLTLSVDTLLVYDWYAKGVGLVLEAASHSGEKNPQFTDAGFLLRLASTNVPSGVEDGPAAIRPEQCELSQNHPNPFNPSTAIDYRLASAGHVTLAVFDILGKPVTVLESGFRPAGSHSAVWNGADKAGRRMPSGVYLCTIEVRSAEGAFSRTRKMILTD